MASQTSFGPQEATAVATCQSQLIQLEQVKPKSQIKPWKNGPQRRGDTVGQGTVGFWRFYTGELENWVEITWQETGWLLAAWVMGWG